MVTRSPKMFQVSNVTLESFHDPAAIHVQNLRIMAAEHKENAARDGPDSPAALYEICISKFLEFYTTKRASTEFNKLYRELQYGFRGTITLGNFPSSGSIYYHRVGDRPYKIINLNGVTQHGVPYTFEFTFSDFRIEPSGEVSIGSNFETPDTRRWINDDTRPIRFTDEYIGLARAHGSNPVVPEGERAAADFWEEFRQHWNAMHSWVGGIYAEYYKWVLAKYFMNIDGKRRPIKGLRVAEGPFNVTSHFLNAVANKAADPSDMHGAFAGALAVGGVSGDAPINDETEEKLTAIIHTVLPGETAEETKERESLRTVATTDVANASAGSAGAAVIAAARYQLAQLHMNHPDAETKRNGALLMRSAANFGDTRASTWNAQNALRPAPYCPARHVVYDAPPANAASIGAANASAGILSATSATSAAAMNKGFCAHQ
jgi:hypothetical protein